MKKILLTSFCVLCLILTIANCFNNNHLEEVFASSNFSVKAKSAILIDYASGEVLFEDKADEQLEIASMVKLMTTYLVIKEIETGNINLQDKFVVSENASGMGGSQVFIDAGSEYSVEQMLQSVIMASANDASVALAEYVSGNEMDFVDKMNKTAQEIGMTNTVYANATGLPAPMQYSSARDTSIILSKLVNNEVYHKYSSRWMDTLTHPSGRTTEVVNTNKLTRYYTGCDCGKTGFTDEAGYCLASSAQRSDMRLISVVVGAKTAKERFSESVALLNYGFANFENKTIINDNQSVGEISVKRSNIKTVNVFPKENFVAVVKKGEKHNFEVTYQLPNKIKAPIVKEQEVGKVIVSKNGNIVKEIALVVKDNVDGLTLGNAINEIIKCW